MTSSASVCDRHRYRSFQATSRRRREWLDERAVRRALRHDQKNPLYNANIRQLIHVGFKVAAKMGPRYLEQLKACRESCARNVTGNLFDRHIKPLFL
ncbi:hypothetical protein EMGBS8_21190 [Verrucomicrobiota bacterium]|nr:hypothetical protein EMGBS8_21190 [Verrucomicrobiota bacterium]